MSDTCGGCCTKQYVSEFRVTQMDCPSEEGIIRMALGSLRPPVHLEFDIPARRLKVFHGDGIAEIESRLRGLGLGASLEYTKPVDIAERERSQQEATQKSRQESKVLNALLAINACMFVVEIWVGWLAQSTGLIADSLDMFADAAVYGVALLAVGKSAQLKLRTAHFSGWLQLALALGALSEVLRRFFGGSEPLSVAMIGMGFVALIANVVCLVLIHKSRDSGAHMKASWIFSANDVIANAGVILAGGLVALTGSRFPDLIIGLIIGVIVLLGARRILMIKNDQCPDSC